MNENSGMTPNPLNPNPAGSTPPYRPAPQAGGAQPAFKQPMRSPRPIQQVGSRRPGMGQAPASAQPVGDPGMASGNTPADAEASMNNMIESLDPTGRPMEQAPVFVDKPKKKTGLIVAFAIFALLLIGGGIAAAVILLTSGGDAVSKAMNKIMAGNAPANVAVDGLVEFRSNDENSPVESIKIDLNSGIMRSSMANTSSAVVTLSIEDMEDLSFNFDEVYADSGDLYLKLEGITDVLNNPKLAQILGGGSLQNTVPVDCVDGDGTTDCATVIEEETTEIVEPETNCIDDETGMTNCVTTEPSVVSGDMTESLSSILGIVEGVDGHWLKISADEMGLITSSGELPTSSVSCITNLVKDLNTGSSSAAEAYDNNPFVTSTTENITLNKKKDPLYKLGVDSEKFASFVNSLDNSALASDVYSCFGLQNNASMTASDVQQIVNSFPEIYAEVNSDYNFSRLYLERDSEEANMTVLIDLSFTYPESVNINAPNDYQDFSTVLQTLFTGIYDMPGGDVVTIEDDEIVEDDMTNEEGLIEDDLIEEENDVIIEE